MADIGSQLCYVVSLGEALADGGAEKIKKLNVFQWVTMEIDWWVHLKIVLEQKGETKICQD